MAYFGSPPVPKEGLPTPFELWNQLTTIPPMAREEKGYEYGTLLPFRYKRGGVGEAGPEPSGKREWAVPGIVRDLYNAFTSTERARTGQLDPTNPLAMYEANNVALNLLGANVAAGTVSPPKPGQVGMLGGPGGTKRENMPHEFVRRAQGYLDQLYKAPEEGGGGFTFDINGNVPQEGFAVAAFPDRGVKAGGQKVMVPRRGPKPGGGWGGWTTGPEVREAADVTPQNLAGFMRQNKALLDQPGNYVGGWRDPHDKTVFLDIVNIVPDQAQAEAIGKAFGERAIYDLKNKREIRLNYAPEEAAAVDRWLPMFEPKIKVGYRLDPVQAGTSTAEQGLRQFRLGREEPAPVMNLKWPEPPPPGPPVSAPASVPVRGLTERGLGLTNQMMGAEGLAETGFGMSHPALRGEMPAIQKAAVIRQLLAKFPAKEGPISGLGTESLPIYGKNTDEAILMANRVLDAVRKEPHQFKTGDVIAKWGSNALGPGEGQFRLQELQPMKFIRERNRGERQLQVKAGDETVANLWNVGQDPVAQARRAMQNVGGIPPTPPPTPPTPSIPTGQTIAERVFNDIRLKELQQAGGVSRDFMGDRHFRAERAGMPAEVDINAKWTAEAALRAARLLPPPPPPPKPPVQPRGNSMGTSEMAPFLSGDPGRTLKAELAVTRPSQIAEALMNEGQPYRGGLVDRFAAGDPMHDILTNPDQRGQRWFAQKFMPEMERRGFLKQQPQPGQPGVVPGPSQFQLTQETFPQHGLLTAPGDSPYNIPVGKGPLAIPDKGPLSAPGPSGFVLTGDPIPSVGKAPDEVRLNANRYLDAVRERDLAILPVNIPTAAYESAKRLGGAHGPRIVNVGGKEGFVKIIGHEPPEGIQAAYEVNAILGAPRAATRVVKVRGENAIVQPAIPKDAVNIGDFNGKLNERSAMDVFAIDMLADARDRHLQNAMVFPDGKVVSIDNDNGFGVFGAVGAGDVSRHHVWKRLNQQTKKADASMFVKIVDNRALLEERVGDLNGDPAYLPARIDKIQAIVEKLRLRENPVVDLDALGKELRKSGLRPRLDKNNG